MNARQDILFANTDSHLGRAADALVAEAQLTLHQAGTLREILVTLSSAPIGLILCNLSLADLPGLSLLTYLKSDPLRETIPFVFFIHARDQERLPPQEAMASGAAGVIVYPIGPGDFAEHLRRHLVGAPSQTSSHPRTVAKDGGTPPGAHVSLNARDWAPCRIINHTFHGAMVETPLRGKQGSPVVLRYPLADGPLTATGKLIHILLGDHERPMGMGINFRGNANWRTIHHHLKTGTVPTASAPKTDPPAAATRPAPSVSAATPLSPPVSMEASRDGGLWMYGEMTATRDQGATIKTPILGKVGETLHIRCTLPGKQETLPGRIAHVRLDNFNMPVAMDITFSDSLQWRQIRAQLHTETASPKDRPSDGELSPLRTEHDAAWEDTVVVAPSRKKTSATEDRFYKSLIGKKLGGYEVASFLSAGGMGGVFKGWDASLERDVAIKVISYALSSQPEFVEMFFKEARLVSKCNHPNIAHIYFIGDENGIVYYAMEFIHGRSLAQLLEKGRTIPAAQAAGYLAAACEALDRVWREHIIHRDLKPANIMISEDGTVKIVDFGVAQQKTDATGTPTNVVGSPPYLSPEVIRKAPVDVRSDIYALGATFHHVLSGSPPFMATRLEDLFRQHLNTPAPSLAAHHPHIPRPLSEIIGKMLAKDPEDRFQSYREIIAALGS